MTGRELIIYILKNRLEDKVFFANDMLMTEQEASEKYNVGPATIRTWYITGMLNGFLIGDNLFILKTTPLQH